MNESESYQEIVGEFLRSFREEHDLTLDVVARAGREHGAGWGTASVKNMEGAKAALTIPTLITLALALNGLTGKSLTLSDLLGRVEVVTLMPGSQPVRRAWLDDILAGGPIHPEPGGIDQRRRYEERKATERAMADREVFRALDDKDNEPPDSEDIELSATKLNFDFLTPSLAEERAANRLGIHSAQLKHWAEVLWGRSLEEEASRRAGSESTPQKRGRITRKLVEDIRKVVEVSEAEGPRQERQRVLRSVIRDIQEASMHERPVPSEEDS